MILEISEDEREMLIRGVALIPDLPGHIMPPSPQRVLIRRLIDLRKDTNPVSTAAPGKAVAVGQNEKPASSAAASSSNSAKDPGEYDHWGASVKGDVKADAVTAEIVINKIDRKVSAADVPYLVVGYPKINGGRGFAMAAVWDDSLFPLITKRLNMRTTVKLHTKGKFVNIVGVRA